MRKFGVLKRFCFFVDSVCCFKCFFIFGFFVVLRIDWLLVLMFLRIFVIIRGFEMFCFLEKFVVYMLCVNVVIYFCFLLMSVVCVVNRLFWGNMVGFENFILVCL